MMVLGGDPGDQHRPLKKTAHEKDMDLILIVVGLIVAALVWFTAAALVWRFRNPLGNDATFITNFTAAMCFQRLPQYQEKMMPATNSLTVDIKKCARCGGNHDDLLFWELKVPCDAYTHWCPCPETNEPILLTVTIGVDLEKKP